jgi:hypothetical protein
MKCHREGVLAVLSLSKDGDLDRLIIGLRDCFASLATIAKRVFQLRRSWNQWRKTPAKLSPKQGIL